VDSYPGVNLAVQVSGSALPSGDSSNRSATEPFDPHCVTPTDPGLICFVSPCVCSYVYPGDITVQIRATDATTGADRRSIIQSVAWSISQNHCPFDPSGEAHIYLC
jgi:hypothetical protein